MNNLKIVRKYRAVCKKCNRIFDLEKKDLVLRNIKGIPINSFYCAFCKQRNYFFS